MGQCWSHILSTATKHSVLYVDAGALLRLVHFLRSRELHDFTEICNRMTYRKDIKAKRNDPINGHLIWNKFIRFVRGCSGPYSKPHKEKTDESLSDEAYRLFGEGPPRSGQSWPHFPQTDGVAIFCLPNQRYPNSLLRII